MKLVNAWWHEVLLVAAACVVLACGAGQTPAGAPSEQRCSEVKYDGIRAEGGAGLLKVASFGAAWEEQAIREMDRYVERYLAAAERWCRLHAAGEISTSEYTAELRRIEALLGPASDYVARLNSVNDPGERKQLLTELHQTLVPKEERDNALRLEFTLEAVLPDGVKFVVNPGDRLPSTTRAAFHVSVNQDAHVYIFQRTAKNELLVQFPHERIAVKNPLAAHTPQRFPPADYFELNEQDLGTENIYLVASRGPVDAMALAARRVASGATGEMAQDPVLAQLSGIVPGKANADCRARAFELKGSVAACARTRGWVLPEETGATASLVVRTDPGDDTIVKVFPFEHITQAEWRANPGNTASRTRGFGIVTEH